MQGMTSTREKLTTSTKSAADYFKDRLWEESQLLSGGSEKDDDGDLRVLALAGQTLRMVLGPGPSKSGSLISGACLAPTVSISEQVNIPADEGVPKQSITDGQRNTRGAKRNKSAQKDKRPFQLDKSVERKMRCRGRKHRNDCHPCADKCPRQPRGGDKSKASIIRLRVDRIHLDDPNN